MIWKLEDLVDTSDINGDGWHVRPADYEKVPADWPDFFEVNVEPEKPSLAATGRKLLEKIGLIQPERRRA